MNWKGDRKAPPDILTKRMMSEIAQAIDPNQPPVDVVTQYAGLRGRIQNAGHTAIRESEGTTSAVVQDVQAMREKVRVGAARCERLAEQFTELVQEAGKKVIADLERQLQSMDDVAGILEAGIQRLEKPDTPRVTHVKADILPPRPEPDHADSKAD